MSDAISRAKRFLNEEKAFRLGNLPSETFHPKTRNLSQTLESNPDEGIRLLQSVDDDIPPVAEKIVQSEGFGQLIDSFLQTIKTEKRFFFTGCGATGRLSILLEAAWRQFWQEARLNHPEIISKCPDREDIAYSVMAGGDFALIKSVEGFEDFTDFGRYQLKEAGVQEGDLVVAITEGGETSFVIGTAWQGLDTGAGVFFVYNNPTDALRDHVQRSREIIEEPRIHKIDLFTGPMAISGSTRMQATTIELLIVGAALEIALTRYLGLHLSDLELKKLGVSSHKPTDYHSLFCDLLSDLSTDSSVSELSAIALLEEDIYSKQGLVTYFADEFMLDVLTDTTERSPTFMTPPYRRVDDTISPRSWAFAKNPFYPTKRAWSRMLRRQPRGLDWTDEVYSSINAPAALRDNRPVLDNNEIYKFQIGNEIDSTRTSASQSTLIVLAAGDEETGLITETISTFGGQYDKTGVLCIGSKTVDHSADYTFHFECGLPESPLKLWHHLASKLILNTLSTATMARMGRVVGNAMVWVSPSNKKLIDRGCRLISHLTGCSYEKACIELHKSIEEVRSQEQLGKEADSPVASAINRIGLK